MKVREKIITLIEECLAVAPGIISEETILVHYKNVKYETKKRN